MAVLLFGAFFLPSRAAAQEREVQDTPKRYRELLKDPRMRAALKGESPSGSGKEGSRGKKMVSLPRTASPGSGTECKNPQKTGGKEEGKEANRAAPKPPPRLKLPPPRMPRPGLRRAGLGGTGGGGASQGGTPAGLPPMGDDSLWPWDPSLVGGSGGSRPGARRAGPRGAGISPGSPGRRGSAPSGEPSGGAGPAAPESHTLFGGDDEPGLFLQVGPAGESRDSGAGSGLPAPGQDQTGPGTFLAAPPAAAGGGAGTGSFLAPSAGGEAAPSAGSGAAAAGADPGPAPGKGGRLPAAERPSSAAPLLSGGAASPARAEAEGAGGKREKGKGSAGEGAEAARRYLDRMFLALGGRKAFESLGGIHASIRITAYDRMGAEVFSRSAEQETLAGPVAGDRLEFRDGPTFGRRGDAFWAAWRGVERPDMTARAREELRVLSFLLRFPFSLEGPEAFAPVDARRARRGGAEEIEVVLQGRGEKAVLRLEPTTCIPREMVYTPPGGRAVRVLFSEWRNFKGVVLPSRKALLSPDGRRVSLEIRTLQVLAGFRWGADHFLPSGKSR